MDHKTIALAGALGRLGNLIARALVDKPGVTVRALVRPGNSVKTRDLAELGVEIVELAIDGCGEPSALDQSGPNSLEIPGRLTFRRARSE